MTPAKKDTRRVGVLLTNLSTPDAPTPSATTTTSTYDAIFKTIRDIPEIQLLGTRPIHHCAGK